MARESPCGENAFWRMDAMTCSDSSQARLLQPDARTPAEVEDEIQAAAVAKAGMAAGRMFALALLAGMFIAFGAMFFCTVLGDASLPFAVQRIVGGACFCLGLALVLCCGAELFTGNVLMVDGVASGSVALKDMLRNWGIVWIGNLIGSLMVVFLVLMAHVPDMNGGAVGSAMVDVAVGKVVPDWPTLFFKGVLCNILVCLAVRIGFSARSVGDKIVGLLLPITAFVACGFEHCVANMFFLPAALTLQFAGFAAGTVCLDLGSIAYNLSAATLGNVAGGALFAGLLYWYAFRMR